MGPVVDVETAFGHKHHAAPATEIGDGAIISDEKRLVLDRFVDKGQRRLRARTKLGDRLRMGHLGLPTAA